MKRSEDVGYRLSNLALNPTSAACRASRVSFTLDVMKQRVKQTQAARAAMGLPPLDALDIQSNQVPPPTASAVTVLGRLLLWVAYPLLGICWLAALIGMTKHGIAILIGMWASVVFVPVVLLGHALNYFGRHKRENR